MTNLQRIYFLQKGFILFILCFLLIGFSHAQQSNRRIESNQGELIQFAKQKGANWLKEKRKADSLANLLNIPISYIDDNSRVVILQRLGRNNKPVYYATDNISSASTISVDQVWTNGNEYPSLSGEGIEINLWDGGSVLTTHQEFQSGSGTRIVMRDTEASLSNHSTHIAGTMIAAGVNPDAKGMAGKATICAWDLNNDLAEMASAAAGGIVVSNHSYGPFCGWYYNTQNESWYWYGDPTISATEDYEFGFYNQVSADLDNIASLAPNYLIVKSAGNDRNDTPTTSSSYEHYVWDGTWKLVNVEREPDGGTDGYDCLSPMAVAKNILTVGAVDDGTSITSFSAFGPTDDGRIKPDVVANGYDVFSSTSATNSCYTVYSGTSMSTASATGSVALLNQLQNILQSGVSFLSSTIKGILIHTASESEGGGPSYSSGWGILNIKEASDLIYNNANNQGKNIYEQVLAEGGVITIPVKTASSSPFLKVTLCWTDPAGQPSTPSLNQRNKRLVNDLDLMIENSNSLQPNLPWILNVENPSASATRGVNHVDNVEQVSVASPGDGYYNVKISHSGSLSGGSQMFSLIISGIETQSNIYPPQNLSYVINESSILLNWNIPVSGTPESYKIYRNGTLLAENTTTSFTDRTVVFDNKYSYYVTAVYNLNNEKIESLGTNQIIVFPQTLRSLPFVVDFENVPTEVIIKNNENGWQWGDSESLNCYYLNFSDNTTKFIGADSYSVGEAVHVTDVAVTAPLRLAEYNNIVLSFDYLLKTGIYDAVDELHVVCKLQEEKEWHELVKLESSFNWKSKSIELPPEICKNGTQIGFYYDDFHQWGMGAGLDNIKILGVSSLTVDFSVNSLISPVSSCILSENENVTVAIKNVGSQMALPGDNLSIQMTSSSGVNVNEQLILQDTLRINDILIHKLNTPLDFSQIGNYTIEIAISSSIDINTSNNTLSNVIDVFGLPTALILNTDLTFCENDAQVLIVVSPSGGVLSGVGVNEMYFNPVLAGAGPHTLTYTITDGNGCVGTITKEAIVFAIPEPEILNTDLTFCENDAQVLIEVSPSGGVLSGVGVNEMYFNPVLAGTGPHTLTYTVTDGNGCVGTITKEAIVFAIPEPEILNTDLTFCENDAQVLIEVSPSGGVLSGTGVNEMYFNPVLAGAGPHTLTYTMTDGNGCVGTITKEAIVFAIPEPEILNTDLTFCENDAQVLIEVSPSGGVLSGTGVNEMYFNPVLAGAGPHTLTYTMTDGNGCVGTITKEAIVFAIPEPEILNTDLTFCENDAQVLIEVSPSGGVLSGTGVNEMYFNPVLAGAGPHTLTYTMTDGNGCVGTITKEAIVFAIPEPEILNTDLTFCENDAQVLIEVSPSGGVLSGTGVNEMYFNPVLAGA